MISVNTVDLIDIMHYTSNAGVKMTFYHVGCSGAFSLPTRPRLSFFEGGPVKSEVFQSASGEEVRAVYDPREHTWRAYSISKPFHITKSSPYLSIAMLLGIHAMWLPLEALGEELA